MNSVHHRVAGVLCLFCVIARPASAGFIKVAIYPPTFPIPVCLTVPGGSTENGKPLVFAPCDASNPYQNIVAQNQVNFVLLQMGISTACGNGMCMTATVPGGDGATMGVTVCDPTNVAQYWTKPVPTGSQTGYTQFKNWASGYCVTAESGGQTVDQYTCQASGAPIIGAPHQLWGIQDPDATGLQAVKSGMLLNLNCLDLKDSNPVPGSVLDAISCSATSYAQHFVVTTNLAVMMFVNGKCVDGGGNSGSVYQYDCTPSAHNQYWLRFLFPNDPNGNSMFLDMLSGLCMTWNPYNINSVTMSTCTLGNPNQYFVIG